MIINGNIFQIITKSFLSGKKQLAILIDPDKHTDKTLVEISKSIQNSVADYVFVGGSFLKNKIDDCISTIKSNTTKPVIIFPGSCTHVSEKADAILLLSLISGRNAEFLIGNHVIAAPHIKRSNLEIISTGYILVDGGKKTSVEYMSNTQPIPQDKNDIATATAIAGEMIGNKLIYLEAGSGAVNSVSDKMISEVKKNISCPLIVGGGIKNKECILQKFNAGADIVVIGNAIENNELLLSQL